jgi:drug/metabolite transporter (DMT)-like permease
MYTSSKSAAAAGIAMVAIYTVQFLAARFSLRENLTPMDITFLRFAGAGVVFAMVLMLRGTARIRELGWQKAITLTLLAGIPYPLVINWGLSYAPAAHAAALCPASIVCFSFVFSRIVLGESISRDRMVGIVCISAGLASFIVGDSASNGYTLFGDLLFVVSGMMFAAFAVLVRRWTIDPVAAGAVTVLLSCTVAPLLLFIAPTKIGASSTIEIVAQIFIQGILAGSLAMFLFTYIVAKLGPQSASLFMPCVPISTAIAGTFVLGEELTGEQMAAIALVAGGMSYPAIRRFLGRGTRSS